MKNQSFRKPVATAACALLFGSLLFSCRGQESAHSPPTEPVASREQTRRELGDHWVQDQQLRRVMQELSSKLQRNTPERLPQDPEDISDANDVERSFRQAQQLADGLAGAAVRIPASVDPAKMDEARHTEFRRLADMLRDHAFTLREAAGAKNVERMQRELTAINSTCIDCHRQFRDFAGLIEFPRASAEQHGALFVASR